MYIYIYIYMYISPGFLARLGEAGFVTACCWLDGCDTTHDDTIITLDTHTHLPGQRGRSRAVPSGTPPSAQPPQRPPTRGAHRPTCSHFVTCSNAGFAAI